MVFPAVTAFYAAILALIYLGLSFWVVAGRGKLKVVHGDGGHHTLQRRIRAHANFSEYVPIILILCALLEARGAGGLTITLLLLPLTIVRLMHPVGMVARENSLQQYLFRAPAALITWIVMAAAAILLLVRLEHFPFALAHAQRSSSLFWRATLSDQINPSDRTLLLVDR